jgi:hypothetical protein
MAAGRLYGAAQAPERSWLMEETFAHPTSLRSAFRLLGEAASLGIHCSVLVVLRSPIEALRSPADAPESSKPLTSLNEPEFSRSWNEISEGFRILFGSVFRYTHRVVFYRAFQSAPKLEAKRLIASIGHSFEARNAAFHAATETVRQLMGHEDMHGFLAQFRNLAAAKPMLGFHHCLAELARQPATDTEILQALFLRYGARFGC